MSLFRTLPPARCLELIHAWTNAPWPLSCEQGQRIAVSVGWRASDDPENYCSDLADDDIDCGFAMVNGEVSWVEFPLTTLADQGCEAETGPQTRALFAQINEVLETEYGTAATHAGSAGITAFIWPLVSGASLRIARSDRLILVRVSSPARTALLNDPAADPNPDENLE